MKVLITGGCGFIGSNLAIRCQKMNWDVTVIDWDKNKQDWRSEANKVDLVYRDYSDPEILDWIKQQYFDIIFHQAAIPRVSYSVKNPAATNDENITKTVRLLEAIKNQSVRFIFASSSSVYGNADIPTKEDVFRCSTPQSPYALQKKTCEEYIRLFNKIHGLDAICLRYFNVIGPYQYGDSPYATALSSWCHRIKNNIPLRKDGSGEQSRDLCPVDNVVQANILAATAKKKFTGQGINIACGERTTNNEILSELRKRFDFEVEQQPFREGDIMHTQADISLAQEIIGYTPVIHFWEGFEKTLRWWNL